MSFSASIGGIRDRLVILIVALVITDTTALGQAQAEVEKRARLERRSAGLLVGEWTASGLEEIAGVDYSEAPLFEGYFQKGLDRHLALENSVAFWRRKQEVKETGGLGGTSRETISSYIIPQFTSLKLYPFTRPSQRAEPYVVAGAGFALGVDDRETSGSGGLLGGQGGSGTSFAAGFGLKAATGVEWRFGTAFGAGAGVRYQWIRFFEDFGGNRTYRGFGFSAGLTYRFQYE